MTNIIDEEIKRTNKNLLIFNGILLITIVIFIISTLNYWYNFIQGPFPKTKSEIINIQKISGLKEYYVELEGDDIFDTGISHIEQEIDRYSNKIKSEKTTDYYELLKLDDAFLLVRVNNLEHQKKVTGILTEIPEDLVKELQKDKDLYSAIRILPFMLEELNTEPDVILGLVLLSIPILISLINIFSSILRNIFKSRHPINTDLKRYFNYDKPVSELIEDFNNAIVDKKKRSFTITKKWILLKLVFKSKFIRLDDILWIYKKITKKSLNFVPYYWSTKVVLFTRYGETIYYKGGDYDRFMETIFMQIPWIAIGWDKNTDILKSNPKKFAEYVDKRKMEMMKIG